MTGDLFTVKDPLGREVRLTEERYQFHTPLEHQQSLRLVHERPH